MNSMTARNDLGTGNSPSPGPSPRSLKAMQIRPKVPDSLGQVSLLPEIHTRDNSIALPSTLQSDFVPEDVLMALVQPPNPEDVMGPGGRHRNLNVSTLSKRRPPPSVWGHPRRDKVKYLTEKTSCVCGAGKDLSFLYDSPKKRTVSKLDMTDKSVPRIQEQHEQNELRRTFQLPDTLIPDEYHIVKNKGVLGLEYTEDQFTTQPMDHDKHFVMFPSLNPTSRMEVKHLKQTLKEMMDRLGINDLTSELRGPTQMHNLIELIKKEQNIYNLVFHELIRQVSVECMDRGELLSELREQYSQLLNRVPLQIKALHEEVLAQRALDRRLTEELMRFKSTICILTSELADVKEHDTEVTVQATRAQEDLKSALAESKKNSSLLSEYHGLYELQRQRLERQVCILSEEKEVWSTAAYSLALKLTNEQSLFMSKRLHVAEKAWTKLANHFTILLTDNDTAQMIKLQRHVDNWRDLLETFHINITIREGQMRELLNEMLISLGKWISTFRNSFVNADSQVIKPPKPDQIEKLHEDFQKWGQVLNEEWEQFGGDTLLAEHDAVDHIRREVDSWTDCSLKVFLRHVSEAGLKYPDHDEMLKMNQYIDELIDQYNVRIAGENGVATGLMTLSSVIETWESKLYKMIHNNIDLGYNEWTVLLTLMEEWQDILKTTIQLIATTQKEMPQNDTILHRHIELLDVMKINQKWLASTTTGIESEDAELMEEVTVLHTKMVKWMVQLLLHLAPNQEDLSKESLEIALEGSIPIPDLVVNAKVLFDLLSNFSKYMTSCCGGIVMEITQQGLDSHQEDPDHEYRDLQLLKSECDDWIETAKLLLEELTDEIFLDMSTTTIGREKTEPGSAEGGSAVSIMASIVSDGNKKDADEEEESECMGTPLPTEIVGDKADLGDTVALEVTASVEGTGATRGTEDADTTKDTGVTKGTGSTEGLDVKESTGVTEGTGATEGIAGTGATEATGATEGTSVTEDEGVTEEPDVTEDSPVVISVCQISEEDVSSLEAEATSMISPGRNPLITVGSSELSEGMHSFEIIDDTSNTRICTIKDQPKYEPPYDTSQPLSPATADPTKSFEAVVALQTLQAHFLTTEKRAQVAEDRATLAESQLKQAQQLIKILKRRGSEEDDDTAVASVTVSTQTTSVLSEKESASQLQTSPSKLRKPSSKRLIVKSAKKK